MVKLENNILFLNTAYKKDQQKLDSCALVKSINCFTKRWKKLRDFLVKHLQEGSKKFFASKVFSDKKYKM